MLFHYHVALATDIKRPSVQHDFPFRYLDVLDFTRFEQIVVDYRISHIVHFSALLSAVAEQNVDRALMVNNVGLQNALNIATKHNIQVFVPSTIGAFGPTTPNDVPVPDLTIQRPTTIYGVTKVFAELLGEYYHYKFGTDFRCLRLPGILSSDQAGGGTTDYAQEMISHAVISPEEEFVSFLGPDSRLPMMYLSDCIRAIDEYTSASNESLTQRTYNIAAMDFSPSELAECVQKYVPSLGVRYEPDFRQAIADTWPRSFDDSKARNDWQWKHEINLDELVNTIMEKVAARTALRE